MPEGYRLREAWPHDALTLSGMVREYLLTHWRGGDPANLTSAERAELDGMGDLLRSGVRGWLARTDAGVPVGCVLRHRDGEMGRLFVRARHQRAGVGSMLAEAAAAGGATWTTIAVDNEPCQRLFETLGWTRQGLKEPGYERWEMRP